MVICNLFFPKFIAYHLLARLFSLKHNHEKRALTQKREISDHYADCLTFRLEIHRVVSNERVHVKWGTFLKQQIVYVLASTFKFQVAL